MLEGIAMKYQGFCVGLVAGVLFGHGAVAEPLKINPYPEKPKSAEVVAETPPPVSNVLEAEVPTLEPAIIDEPVYNAPAPIVSVTTSQGLPPGVQVPQPGDAYFDAAPADFVPDMAPAPVVENFAEPEVIEMVDAEPMTAVVAQPEEEPIVLRMSDSYDDMIGDSFENRPQKTMMDKRPVLEAESSVVASSDADLTAPPVREPEVIEWNEQDRLAEVPPQEPVQAVDQSQSSSVPFRALEGSNIYQVLDAWAKDENVELLWDSDNSFAVLETFETEAIFLEVPIGLMESTTVLCTSPSAMVSSTVPSPQ